MSSNEQSNHPSSNVKRSQPKRRKIAILPALLADEPLDLDIPLDIHIRRQTQHSGNPEEQAAFRVLDVPSKSTPGPSIETPIRSSAPTVQIPSSRGLSVTPRMLAINARPQARSVQEQAGRLSPMVLRNLPSKSMPNPNPQVQRRSTAMRAMSIRRTPMISRSGSTASKKITKSFPSALLYLPDSGGSSEDDHDDTNLSKPRILWTSDRIPVVMQRAARKSKTQLARKSASKDQQSQNNQASFIDSDFSEDNNNEEDLDLNVDGDDARRSAQRLRDGQSSEAEPEVMTPEDMEKELSDVLNALTICEVKLHARGRLPFLRRNVRRSMDALGPAKWRGHNPDAVRSTNIAKVDVVYVMLDYESPGGSFTGKWFCPLCAIKMWFRTRGALDTHIYHYHTQCDYDWVQGEDNVLLRLAVPEVPDSDSGREEDEDELCTSEEEESSEEEQENPTTLMSSPREEKPFLRGPSVIKASTISFSSSTKVQPVSPQLSPLQPRKEKEIKAREVLRPPRPIDSIDPERYPTPPPLDNLEGPAAIYPYVSCDTYSARPGGPKLYDLLNELSLEPFGLMSWYIIDKEEDIFELDNMRDEDKVMLAIWGRWIFLNRPKFIENYGTGIRLFIDEYWRIIHRAAGFSALRTWLLVLVQNRFLTGNQFCDALKYYIDLVGMDHWTAKCH